MIKKNHQAQSPFDKLLSSTLDEIRILPLPSSDFCKELYTWIQKLNQLNTLLCQYAILELLDTRKSLIDKIIHNLARLIQEMGQQSLKSLSERPLETA